MAGGNQMFGMKCGIEFQKQTFGGKIMRRLLRMDVPLHLHVMRFALKGQTVARQMDSIFRLRADFLGKSAR